MILDIEATSLHGTRSYPIEIAWKSSEGELKSFLINLSAVSDVLDWSDESQSIHGIQLSESFEQGFHPHDVVRAFMDDYDGQPPYSDGPEYDFYWITQLFKMAQVKVPFNQIIPVTDLYIRELKKNGFSPKDSFELAEQILENDVYSMRTHRALGDVEAVIHGLNVAKSMKPEIKARKDHSYDFGNY